MIAQDFYAKMREVNALSENKEMFLLIHPEDFIDIVLNLRYGDSVWVQKEHVRDLTIFGHTVIETPKVAKGGWRVVSA